MTVGQLKHCEIIPQAFVSFYIFAVLTEIYYCSGYYFYSMKAAKLSWCIYVLYLYMYNYSLTTIVVSLRAVNFSQQSPQNAVVRENKS